MIRTPRVRRSSSVRGQFRPGVDALEGRALLSTMAMAASTKAHVAQVEHHRAAHAPTHATLGLQRHKVATPMVSPAATPASTPYTPSQIRHAYGFDQISQDGTGQTIAIVDAYNDPTVASDLHYFDQQFGLADPTLNIAYPSGRRPQNNSGWAGEIALDVEWAHVIAPKATILLVETANSSYASLTGGVTYAVNHGASQVSMSWGGGEVSGYDSVFKHPGVTFLNASGDSGYGASSPATSPYVTAVGGTSLTIDTSSNRISETGWSGSGGGVSSTEALPPYQAGFFSGGYRGEPDVSYDADPNTGYYVYQGGSWYAVGGTSAAAPQWAGLIALANQGRAAAKLSPVGSGTTYGTNQVLYSLAGSGSYANTAGDYVDITSGSNGGAAASTGYDLVTGLGSPVANKIVPALINA